MIASTWVVISAVIALGGSTYTGKQTASVMCNNPQGKKGRFNPFQLPAESFKHSESSEGWQDDYFEPVNEGMTQEEEYQNDGDETLGSPMRKRVAVSPYISFGAFNNLPQFFEQLKESIENQELHKAHQMAAAAAAAADNYRPPSTAAVLNAFRNHGYRRTRSYPYPPALVHG